jgi:hypothetical protein
MASSALGAPSRMASLLDHPSEPAVAEANDCAPAGAEFIAIAAATQTTALRKKRLAMRPHFADEGKALLRHYG